MGGRGCVRYMEISSGYEHYVYDRPILMEM